MTHNRRTRRTSTKADPHAAREAAKYENPIPSREFILDMLGKRASPLSYGELADVLALTDTEPREALRRRMNAMERDGQVLRNRRGAYLVSNRADLIAGRVIGHPDGFGFLVADSGGDDLFLSAREMRTLLHGDRALVRIAGIDRRGRREGAVVEVLERAHREVVGRFFREGGIGFVEPHNRRLAHKIIVPAEHQGDARPNQVVVVELMAQPSAHAEALGRVIEVLGEHMAPGMEIELAMRTHGLGTPWPEAVERAVATLPSAVPEADKAGREDLRGLPLVTIDGADARDFDDAVYCERKTKSWRLIVAIADVAHYVQPGSALDTEAQARGNSVYFPERVIPMLPEPLSNGLCSLNPHVDRLCMVAELSIDGQGEVKRSRFYRAVMRSQARLTYDEAAALVVDRVPGLRAQYAAVVPALDELYALYGTLRAARERRGAIDFDTHETRIVFGADRKIERIVPVIRNDAHRLIEECMIAANVATARFLLRHKAPCLYRIHGGPKPDKLTDLRAFLGEFGLSLQGGEKPGPEHYAALIHVIAARPDRALIETVLLRSLAQAVYNPDNAGHFGLALPAYAHFTSPIRRYPDLVVHRSIADALAKQPKAAVDLTTLGEHCSMTERRADEATREAVDWLKCEYMMDKVGEEFSGTISTVTSFGFFVQLDAVYVEGLVHVSALKNDYYHFDPIGHRLVGERSATRYRLGDRVTVQVVRVDLDERKIDFVPVTAVPATAPAKKKRSRASKPRM